jgi:hypothetical protein
MQRQLSSGLCKRGRPHKYELQERRSKTSKNDQPNQPENTGSPWISVSNVGGRAALSFLGGTVTAAPARLPPGHPGRIVPRKLPVTAEMKGPKPVVRPVITSPMTPAMISAAPVAHVMPLAPKSKNQGAVGIICTAKCCRVS